MTTLNYLKRPWNETRGDEYDAWGTSWWYFEVGSDGSVSRQIEQYAVGVFLRYSVEHEEDIYGRLACVELDLSDAEYCEISSQEFESVWNIAVKNA